MLNAEKIVQKYTLLAHFKSTTLEEHFRNNLKNTLRILSKTRNISKKQTPGVCRIVFECLNTARRGYFHFIKNCGLLTSPTPCSLLFMWSSPLNARRKDNPDKNRRYKTPKILIIICSGSFRLWKSLLWKMWLRGIWLLRSVGFEESETWLVSQFWEFKIDKAGRSKELK